jgi:hypothetical protein
LGYPWVEGLLEGVDGGSEGCLFQFRIFCSGLDFVVYSEEIFEDGGVAGDVAEVSISCVFAIWTEFSGVFSDDGFEDLLERRFRRRLPQSDMVCERSDFGDYLFLCDVQIVDVFGSVAHSDTITQRLHLPIHH